ncbi:uncharacterized protein LOC117588493 isoform X1 [Drosophila guanche]|uniref:Uncharacterized protein n=1 Tax=Drosophila guanche TaxID=7266 RepID=A0A3B0JX40_DROGU|nr:uncharacterized protein LOC117588493 isoform X1 [Drosophila guanche]SPP86624.1 Hypothetical predicted protein [Drosophila guanche]
MSSANKNDVAIPQKEPRNIAVVVPTKEKQSKQDKEKVDNEVQTAAPQSPTEKTPIDMQSDSSQDKADKKTQADTKLEDTPKQSGALPKMCCLVHKAKPAAGKVSPSANARMARKRRYKANKQAAYENFLAFKSKKKVISTLKNPYHTPKIWLSDIRKVISGKAKHLQYKNLTYVLCHNYSIYCTSVCYKYWI